MNSSVLLFKVYGFRTASDQSKPIAIVARSFEDAISKWSRIYPDTEPLDICILSEAYF